MNNKPTVKLRQRVLKDGTANLYLDKYCGTTASVDDFGKIKYKANRMKKNINLSICLKPQNARERAENKRILKLAEEIRRQEELDLCSVPIINTREDLNTSVDFYEFYEEFEDSYTKKDLRQVRRGRIQFIAYLKSKRKYRHLTTKLDINNITPEMIEGYAKYLSEKFKGEGAHTVFARFKKVFKRAVYKGLINRNPCQEVIIKCNSGLVIKETLTPEEIEILRSTHFNGENAEVKRAFMFCLHTGIRGCDVRELTFENVRYAERILQFEQKKTHGHSRSSLVQQPLTDYHFELIGRSKTGNRQELIFNLPSDTYCNRQLKDWMKAAGIDKHITWHCARHSFGTNLCEKDVNPVVIMSLMGHSSLKYTNVYVKARDKAKKEAMEALCGDLNTKHKI